MGSEVDVVVVVVIVVEREVLVRSSPSLPEGLSPLHAAAVETLN